VVAGELISLAAAQPFLCGIVPDIILVRPVIGIVQEASWRGSLGEISGRLLDIIPSSSGEAPGLLKGLFSGELLRPLAAAWVIIPIEILRRPAVRESNLEASAMAAGQLVGEDLDCRHLVRPQLSPLQRPPSRPGAGRDGKPSSGNAVNGKQIRQRHLLSCRKT
jgi:hypothetical protein